MDACAARADCFPHWDGYRLICREAEPVNCSLDATKDEKKLMLFASQGLVNNALKRGLRDLVMRLPNRSWSTEDEEIGAMIKQTAQSRDDCVQSTDRAELSWRGVNEPDLYRGLTAVVLWDACYLKESFWNAAHPDFGRYSNYIKMTETMAGPHRRTMPRTSPRLARGDTTGSGSAATTNTGNWSGLEEGYCEDFTPWLTEELGFEPERVHRISLFDRLSSANLTRFVFAIQKSKEDAPNPERINLVQREISRLRAEIGEQLEDPRSEASRLLDLLQTADVVALNGGNPDFLKFVLTEFAQVFTNNWTRQVELGQTIFLGRSAGSMVGGYDISLTSEPNPLLLEYLLPDTGALHRGLGLAGRCTIRPHYGEHWDVVVALARQMQSHTGGRLPHAEVVRVGNEEAMQCMRGRCKMIGMTSRQALPPLSKPQLRRLMRGFEESHAAGMPLFHNQDEEPQCQRGWSDFD